MTEREQLEQAITALEAQRAILGDAVVDVALAPLREKLAAASAAARPAGTKEAQQRKQVTILFADVSGFTAMSETMDPEEVSTTMNALWTRLDTAILDQGGRIDKHIGDAVMALFGAPAAREDDPERAIRAALAMQAGLAAFVEAGAGRPARGAGSGQPVTLRMRIGINTGPVLLGAVGTTGEYTAMGDTVNLASRLEHAAPVGGILISHDTYRHVRGIFEVQPLEPITVKGKTDPIQVYVVRGTKPRAFRVTTRGVEGIETRTIGREAELKHLQDAYRASQADSRTHLVNLVADAGVGKSRLLYEFNNWLDLLPEDIVVFRGRATLETMKLPYSLIRDVLASRFDIEDGDRASAARDKLERGFVEVMGPDGLEPAHFVGHLIGFDFAGSPYLQGILSEARQIRDRAFHYLAQFFSAAATQSPTVVFLEDIHWADDSSLDLVSYLLNERPNLPLLVLGLARSTVFERRPAWGEGPMTHIRLDLQPLTQQVTRQLVAEILRKAREVPARLQDLIVRRAEGNSFYVEELIKVLIEDGVIVTGEEVWHVDMSRLDEVRIPATLTGVLQSRLDGLPTPERETLQQASVIGRVFWSGVLGRLQNPEAGLPPAPVAVEDRIGALNRRELVFRVETSAFSETQEYIFKHAMLHDVTYESVLKRMRRAYHAQVAASLIELSGERAPEYAGRIGEHFERAEAWAQAAEWYGRAGRQAQDTYAPEAAIGYYQKALELWKIGGQTMPSAQQFEVYDGLGEMLVIQARYAEGIETYTAMRRLAETAEDQVALSRAWHGLALAQGNQGDNRSALESATQAEAAARAAGAQVEAAKALWMKGRSLFRLGDPEGALALAEQMLARATEAADQRQMVRSLNLLGAIHNILGRYEPAESCFTRALRISEELGDRTQTVNLLNNLGVIAAARGDYREALKPFEEAVTITREIGDRDGELIFLSNVGAARVELGEHAAAEADLRQVIEMAGEAGSGGLSDTYHYLAEAYLGQHKLDEALEAARQALILGQAIGEQAFIAAAWRTLGRIGAHLDRPLALPDPASGKERSYTAAEFFAESLRVCTETGMEGEQARTLRAWARHELAHGDAARGREMWNQAREIYSRLGVQLEVERMAEPPAPGA